MEKHIASLFHEYFEMVPVTTDELREAVYRLRYQVFCKELNLWDASSYPDEMEKDKYDAHSEHYLIRHKGTGRYAATTRLILCNPDAPEEPLPTESHCVIERTDLLDKIPRNQLAEVSRFCVSRAFKRRKGEDETPSGVVPQIIQHPYISSEDERRAWPILTLALIACLNEINAHRRTTHWFSMLEPPVFRLYTTLGIYFTPIGPMTYCYEKHRLPCVIQVPDYLNEVKIKNKENWDIMTDFGRLFGS